MLKFTFVFTLFICIFFSLVSCNNPTDSSSTLSEGTETVEVIFGDQQISLSASNYEELTEEALRLFESEKSQYEPNYDQIQKWFIRYYIQMHEYNEEFSNDELFELAEERYEYEDAWIRYANKEYSVKVSKETLESEAVENFEIYQNNLPPSVRGMSNGLDLTIEEFMLDFDRDHVERSVIWEKLMPTLTKKLQEEENQPLDGVYLGQLYEKEVLNFLEEQENKIE